ncbi:hypothetical protein ACWGBH_17865 [Streptomyces massasporeus]
MFVGQDLDLAAVFGHRSHHRVAVGTRTPWMRFGPVSMPMAAGWAVEDKSDEITAFRPLPVPRTWPVRW